MTRYLSLFLFSVVVFSSCKDKIESEPSGAEIEKSYRYFPLAAGNWMMYDVDSIIHEYADDHTNQPDSLISSYHFQVLEVADSSFIDGEGQIAWRISRYRRDADTMAWNFINVWTAKRTNASAQRVEDNVRYVKLSFPVESNASWNGNAFNSMYEEEYNYSEVNVPLSLGGLNFDSSLTVIQKEDFNLIHQILKKEQYVSGVGMAFKEMDSLNLNGLQQVTNGYEFRETLIGYGH